MQWCLVLSRMRFRLHPAPNLAVHRCGNSSILGMFPNLEGWIHSRTGSVWVPVVLHGCVRMWWCLIESGFERTLLRKLGVHTSGCQYSRCSPIPWRSYSLPIKPSAECNWYGCTGMQWCRVLYTHRLWFRLHVYIRKFTYSPCAPLHGRLHLSSTRINAECYWYGRVGMQWCLVLSRMRFRLHPAPNLAVQTLGNSFTPGVT